MEDIVEIRAIVRIAMLDRVVRCLKESGVPRLTVTRVHAIGAGVDPASTSLSFEEGSVYSDKAQVQFICTKQTPSSPKYWRGGCLFLSQTAVSCRRCGRRDRRPRRHRTTAGCCS